MNKVIAGVGVGAIATGIVVYKLQDTEIGLKLKYTIPALRNIKKEVAKATDRIEDQVRRMYWLYTHPEILGVAHPGNSGGPLVGWLDPFTPPSPHRFREREGKGMWTWADAPDFNSGAQPMGKVLELQRRAAA